MHCINFSFSNILSTAHNNRVSCIKKINFFQFVFALGNIMNHWEREDHCGNETSELHLNNFVVVFFNECFRESCDLYISGLRAGANELQ